MVRIEGKTIECVTIGVLAAAIRRTPHTIRTWEREGLIPPAPLTLASRDPRAVRRLYPIELVTAIQSLAETAQFGQHRANGMFTVHQHQFWALWSDFHGNDGAECVTATPPTP